MKLAHCGQSRMKSFRFTNVSLFFWPSHFPIRNSFVVYLILNWNEMNEMGAYAVLANVKYFLSVVGFKLISCPQNSFSKSCRLGDRSPFSKNSNSKKKEAELIIVKVKQSIKLNPKQTPKWEININKYTYCVGGWSLSWNHNAFPSRWTPWHTSGGVASSSSAGNQRASSTNRGLPWNSNTSQRSWHTARQANSKYNRWEKNQTQSKRYIKAKQKVNRQIQSNQCVLNKCKLKSDESPRAKYQQQLKCPANHERRSLNVVLLFHIS